MYVSHELELNEHTVNKIIIPKPCGGNGKGPLVKNNKNIPTILQQTHADVSVCGIDLSFLIFPAIYDDNMQTADKPNAPAGDAIKFILDYINNNIKKNKKLI